MEYSRWQKDNVKESLNKRRVIVLSGSRQCGKTTLIKQIARSIKNKVIFRSLDDNTLLKSAIDDPINFVKTSKETMIIDEFQKAVDLLPAIKQVVDNNNAPGQFLLTGSADIQPLPEVSESLAGRVKNIRLRPLTQGEILGIKPRFLEKCIPKDFESQIKGYDKQTLIEQAFRGGYPEVISSNQKDRRDWHKDYKNTLLKRDLRDITNINRQDAIRDLFTILNAWSGKLIDLSIINSSFAISRNSLQTYTNALESLFLFEKLSPWLKTDYERVSKKTKTFATDTGLMASTLQWKESDILLDPDKSGKLIETLVFNELSAQVDFSGDYNFYQYRDRESREIDFIIEDYSGNIIAIEVKSSMLSLEMTLSIYYGLRNTLSEIRL
jgi:predicted AAA+ superfamily ATPase